MRANARALADFISSAIDISMLSRMDLLRRLLGDYLGLPPAAIRFDVGRRREAERVARDWRPRRCSSTCLTRVMSVLIAITRSAAVGVDVERWSADVEPETLAEQFFSAGECEQLRSLAPEERLAGFFSCWTQKEAYIKATGLGVSKGLDYFDVVVAPESLPALLADRLSPAPADRWRMMRVAIEPGYSTAVAVEMPVSRLCSFGMEPPEYSSTEEAPE